MFAEKNENENEYGNLIDRLQIHVLGTQTVSQHYDFSSAPESTVHTNENYVCLGKLYNLLSIKQSDVLAV